MNKRLIAFIWPLLLMAMSPSAQAWLATNQTNFPILVRNGGGGAAYKGTIPVGSSGACASGSNGCGSGSNPDQYLTMAQAGAGTGQLCAGSGVPSDGSIVYTSTDSGVSATIYDSSGTVIWSGPLQGDPSNGHNTGANGNKTVSTNSNGELQPTYCGANSYNPYTYY